MLSSQPFFAGCPIISEDVKDIQNTIQTAVSKIGVCGLVLTPNAGLCSSNSPRPYFERVRLIVRFVEMVPINRGKTGTQIPARDFAEMAAILLHNYCPFKDDGSNQVDVQTTIVLDEPSITIVPDKIYAIWDIRARTNLGIDSSLLLRPPAQIITNSNPNIRFVSGNLQLWDSALNRWSYIGSTNGQLFNQAPTTTDPCNIRFTSGSLEFLDVAAGAWLTLGASDGQLFLTPTTSGLGASIRLHSSQLQILDSVTNTFRGIGLVGEQFVLS